MKNLLKEVLYVFRGLGSWFEIDKRGCDFFRVLRFLLDSTFSKGRVTKHSVSGTFLILAVVEVSVGPAGGSSAILSLDIVGIFTFLVLGGYIGVFTIPKGWTDILSIFVPRGFK